MSQILEINFDTGQGTLEGFPDGMSPQSIAQLYKTLESVSGIKVERVKSTKHLPEVMQEGFYVHMGMKVDVV